MVVKTAEPTLQNVITTLIMFLGKKVFHTVSQKHNTNITNVLINFLKVGDILKMS